MSVTARSLLLIGAFLALLLSQYAVAEAIAHHTAFLMSPAIVPEPTLFDAPLLRMAFVLVSLGAVFELLAGDPIPLRGWTRPFDRSYSGQHSVSLLTAGMILIIASFAFFLVRESEPLQQWFWWSILGLDGLLGIVAGLCVLSWLRTGKVTSFAAE